MPPSNARRRAPAIVVLLVVTASLAIASAGPVVGPASAAAVDPADADRSLDSGGLFWAGQTAFFDGSEVVTDVQNATADDRTFQLRRVTSDGAAGILVREVVVDADGTVLLDTSGLVGRYVLLHDGNAVYVQNGTGYTSAPPDGSPVTVESSRWEVATQTVSATWSDDTVFRSSTADLRVDSNRGTFVLAVSADGLDYDDLVSMFDADDFAADHDARADEDVLLLDAGGVTAFAVRFADLKNGRYTLVIEAADADARTTAGVRVGRPSSGDPSPTPTASPSPTATPVPPTATPTTSTDNPTPTTTTEGPTGTPASPTDARPPSTESPGQPGFGAAVALGALGLGLLVARWRLA